MMADKLLNAQDLITAKKHDTFRSEVITGKVGGLSTGADIDYATNAVTGQVQKTLPATVNGIDWSPVGNLTTDNCTFTKPTDYAVDDNGTQWAYNGTFPFTSTAPVVPSAPDYYVVHVSSAEAVKTTEGFSVQQHIDSESGKSHDQIYRRKTTVAEIASGVFSVGDLFEVSDRVGAKFNVVAGGTPNGFDILDAGNGNTAVYQINEDMPMVHIGFDSTRTSKELAQIVYRACEIARTYINNKSFSFPSGTFYIDRMEIDIDKRGYTIGGAGQDNTLLVSTSKTESMVVNRIDPRDRSRDRFHDYLTISGFTIDGDISGRGALAATKCVVMSYYCKVGFKSVGHRTSNMDLNGLVTEYTGHTQGRINGSVKSEHSLRLRNNAIKCVGNCYTNNGSGDKTKKALTCESGITTTTAAITAGDVSFTVVDASKIEKYDRIEIGQSPTVIDVRWVVDKSGNTITVDSPLDTSQISGSSVKIPVVGNSYRGTIESGRIDISNIVAFTLDATYMEESRILVRGKLEQLKISGSSNVEQSPAITIDSVHKDSQIQIDGNNTGFSIGINVADRDGNIAAQLDLYNMPILDIKNNTRKENTILVNGNAFTSLRTERHYRSDIGGEYQTDMYFTGYYLSVPTDVTSTGLQFFSKAVAGINYDGYTAELDISARRAGSTNVRTGIFKRVGTMYTDGSVNDISTTELVTDYVYSADAGNRVNVFFSGDNDRMTTRYAGESAGTDTIFITSGKVSHLL